MDVRGKNIGYEKDGYYRIDHKNRCLNTDVTMPQDFPSFEGGVFDGLYYDGEGYKKSTVSTRAFSLPNCKLNAFCDQVKPQYFSFPLKDSELEYDV